jgi:hypothetical protein
MIFDDGNKQLLQDILLRANENRRQAAIQRRNEKRSLEAANRDVQMLVDDIRFQTGLDPTTNKFANALLVAAVEELLLRRLDAKDREEENEGW